MSRDAIIAGSGGLPLALAVAMDAAMSGRPLICALHGHVPHGLPVDQVFRVERLALFMRHLEDQGVARVCFAGSVQRPRLDPALFDPHTASMVPRLLAAMGQGDDATLREVIAIFEEAGFAVVGVADLAPALLPGEGLLCGALTEPDYADATRAAAIVAALGAVDVGQGAVVAQGLCLGVETLAGTDAMLAGVAGLPAALRPAGSKGLFYKAAKPGQDRRIDLPTLGVDTVERVAGAGLGGVAFQAGSVICLDLPAMIAAASARGLFLWSRG